MPFWERKQTIKILWQISPPPRILTLTTYTHTGKANRPPVHNCTGLSVQSLHTEWWLPLSPAFVRLLWEEQFTESIIDFCHNRYRDASPFPLSQLALRIATVRPVCEVPSLFFFKEIHHKVWGMGGGGVRKVMKIKLFSPCHTEECSRPSLEMSTSIMEQQKNRRKKDFCRHPRKINTHTRRKVVGTYWK